MSNKSINTKQVQNYFSQITDFFVDVINENMDFVKNNTELSLLINKINTNIRAIGYLCSMCLFNESGIIFRSAFESVVLFEYIVEYPAKIEQYKKDNLISEFHQLYLGFIRSYLTEKELIEAYNKLYNEIGNIVPFEETTSYGIITYNTKKLEEYFRGDRNSFKPLSQQTNKLIDELKKNNSKHSKILYELKMEFYNYYSQICHNKLSTLTTSMKNYKPQQRLEELQSLFKNCFLLYQIIFDTLYDRFKIPRQAKFFSLLIEIANYLGLNFSNINLLYRD